MLDPAPTLRGDAEFAATRGPLIAGIGTAGQYAKGELEAEAATIVTEERGSRPDLPDVNLPASVEPLIPPLEIDIYPPQRQDDWLPGGDPFNEVARYDDAAMLQSLNTLDPADFADTDTVVGDDGREETYGIIGMDTDDEVAIKLNSVEPAPEGMLANRRQQSREAGEDYLAANTPNAALAFETGDAFPEEDETFVQQFGTTLGDLNVGLQSIPRGVAIGFAKLMGNAWGAFFPQLQADIDAFWKPVDEFYAADAVKGHPMADVAGSVAEIGTQLVLPVGLARNKLMKVFKAVPLLRRLGLAAPLATIVAEAAVGFFAFSPKDETIINTLIDADEHDPTLKAVRDWLATDPGNESAYAARSKHALEALLFLGLGEVAVRGFIKTVSAARTFATTGPGKAILAMAAAAGVAAPDDAEGGGLSKFFGLAKRVLGPDVSMSPSRTGGLTFPAAESSDRLRLKLQREAGVLEGKAMPGAPANDRRVIRAPKGSKLPNFVVGKVTHKDWITRTEKILSPDEIGEAAKWYDKIRGVFLEHTQGDVELADAYMRGWLVTQQNVDVTGALNNLLLQAEQFARGVPVDQMRAAGMPNPTGAARSVCCSGGAYRGRRWAKDKRLCRQR